MPTFAREFNDDGVPPRCAPSTRRPPTHLSERPYLFDLPDAIQYRMNPDQEPLAARMRRPWANFAANGDPSPVEPSSPYFDGMIMMSFAPPQPQVVIRLSTILVFLINSSLFGTSPIG